MRSALQSRLLAAICLINVIISYESLCFLEQESWLNQAEQVNFPNGCPK
jgi:hypothetical protein